MSKRGINSEGVSENRFNRFYSKPGGSRSRRANRSSISQEQRRAIEEHQARAASRRELEL